MFVKQPLNFRKLSLFRSFSKHRKTKKCGEKNGENGTEEDKVCYLWRLAYFMKTGEQYVFRKEKRGVLTNGVEAEKKETRKGSGSSPSDWIGDIGDSWAPVNEEIETENFFYVDISSLNEGMQSRSFFRLVLKQLIKCILVTIHLFRIPKTEWFPG